MKFKLTFITGLSLMLMALGLLIGIYGDGDDNGKRYFLIMLGILGWAIGNQLVDLNERVTDLEEHKDKEQTKTSSTT